LEEGPFFLFCRFLIVKTRKWGSKTMMLMTNKVDIA